MLVKLSSKGQIVLPKGIRKALHIGPGSVLKVVCDGQRIVLEPVATSMIDRLHGKYAGADLLGDLEAEHTQELRREQGP
jgi:AbrB family looped-hinge helix DNA binding protein